MDPPDPDRTLELLDRLARGDRTASDELIDRVYRELHTLAAAQMAGGHGTPTLQPTALVHEAWMRLVSQPELRFEGRAQFYRYASRVMRSVVVDHSRRRNSEKRGGGQVRIALEAGIEEARQELDVLDLEHAMQRLQEQDPELVQIVELRFFGGLSHPEIARTLGSSLRTVERQWRFARAWLRRQLVGEDPEPEE